MLTVVKRTEDDLASFVATEAGFIAGLCRYEGEAIELEKFQLAFLENRSRFRWITKSRQVGGELARMFPMRQDHGGIRFHASPGSRRTREA